jgi:hypothetical protein
LEVGTGTSRSELSHQKDQREDQTLHERPHIDRANLATLSAAIALVCVVILTLQIRDRWQPPQIKAADQAEHALTGKIAHAAGATLSQTDPKLSVEPAPAGPKQAQPADLD